MSLYIINLLDPDQCLPEDIRDCSHQIVMSDQVRENILELGHGWCNKLNQWCSEFLTETCYLLQTPGGIIFVLTNSADYMAFRLSWG